MRDIVLVTLLVVTIPFALRRPIYGVLLWALLSLMNPHRLTWGFAYDMPFAMFTAIATIIGLLITSDEKQSPFMGPMWWLALFIFWISLGFPFSMYPEPSYDMWIKVLKIQAMTFVAVALIMERKHVIWFVSTVVASLGFYGVKGGIFTLRGAGVDRVWGPSGSFIEGNNEIALALIITIPLMWYLFEIAANKWARGALVIGMFLSMMAALGSQSRGALVGLVAMIATFWWYSKRKLAIGVVLLGTVPFMIAFMPESWERRMATIATYDSDASATGRINAWWNAWNLAKDHPIFGGGFEIYNAEVFARYAPIPTDIHAAHSIYFQVLGEHGWIAFVIFFWMWVSTWRTAQWLRRHTTPVGPDRWAFHLAAMSQVSLAGFAVGGAFLSLAYFDLPYYLMAVLVATRAIIARKMAQSSDEKSFVVDKRGERALGTAPP